MNSKRKAGRPAHKKPEALDSAASNTPVVAPAEANRIQTTDTPLTPAETELLVKCEETIGRGLKAFLEVAEALLEVRDQRLYRTEYETFQEYCRQKWKITARHANRLMLASECVENLRSDQLVSSEPAALPENEAQARPLTGLPPAKQVKAARIVAKKAGKHTTKDFEDAAKAVVPKKPKAPKTRHSDSQDSEEETPRIQSYDIRENEAEEKKIEVEFVSDARPVKFDKGLVSLAELYQLIAQIYNDYNSSLNGKVGEGLRKLKTESKKWADWEAKNSQKEAA